MHRGCFQHTPICARFTRLVLHSAIHGGAPAPFFQRPAQKHSLDLAPWALKLGMYAFVSSCHRGHVAVSLCHPNLLAISKTTYEKKRSFRLKSWSGRMTFAALDKWKVQFERHLVVPKTFRVEIERKLKCCPSKSARRTTVVNVLDSHCSHQCRMQGKTPA